MNWDSLLANPFTDVSRVSAGTLMKYVCDGTHSLVTGAGTFTISSQIISFLDGIGYNDVQEISYSFPYVKSALSAASMVVMSGKTKGSNPSTHAWIIDKYKRTLQTDYYLQYNDKGVVIGNTTRTRHNYYVHCDMGLGGIANGYYYDGIFDQSNVEADEEDNSSDLEKPMDYCVDLKIIKYEK